MPTPSQTVFRCLLILFGVCMLASCGPGNPGPYDGWEATGGTKENMHYSTASELDTNNVNRLQVAWVYHTGDADTAHHSQIQCNPIVVKGILYATSPQMKLIALDAATGAQKWVFNPYDTSVKNSVSTFIMNNNRGVCYWENGTDQRVFYVAGSFLYCVDAATGKLNTSFGQAGKLDLHDGLGDDAKDRFVISTSPGMVYHDLIIMGTRVSEESDAAPGYIRAYDVRTGKQQWVFHTIPLPGEFGYDSWEDPHAYKEMGGANCWAGFALDPTRGILFAPTGSASFDFYGGRRKGDDLFADCLLALDATTGKRIWHFQDVHHDTWDKDLPTAPSLVTLNKDGKEIDAVAQPTKTGFIFLLDRQTGKPIYPVEERAVPHETELAGEKLSPTQPIPTLPPSFMRQRFSEADIDSLLPDSSYRDIKKKFQTYKSGNVFEPMSKEGTIVFPGLDGGAEWGGAAFDPESGLLYVNANEMPWVITIADRMTKSPEKETYGQAGKRLYTQNCMTCHGPERQGGGNNPALIGVNKKYSLDQFLGLLATGRRMMPAFSKLSQEEKQAVASFVLETRSVQNKKFVAPPASVDTFRNLPYTITGYNKFLSKEGYPAINPPWGTLSAINLNTGAIAWKIPLGDYPVFKAKGIATGTENYGGPVVTRGGLVFIAASRDGKLRVFNKMSGKLLWETDLPAPGFATPAVYRLNGREFVVIACGGGKLGTQSGDSYIAFALPAN
jgi:quinoprotein glucose dehydrogenase